MVRPLDDCLAGFGHVIEQGVDELHPTLEVAGGREGPMDGCLDVPSQDVGLIGCVDLLDLGGDPFKLLEVKCQGTGDQRLVKSLAHHSIP